MVSSLTKKKEQEEQEQGQYERLSGRTWGG
jgi:hypothetical protein